MVSLALSGVETLYQVQSFKAVSGWMYFAITVQEIYGNSILTFYAAANSYSNLLPSMPAKGESTTLQGFYTDPAASPAVKIYFGCRRNMNGVCYRSMSGYFFNFKIWADKSLTQA